MDNELHFEFCNDHRGDTINVFIHGYSAIRSDEDKKFLKQCIPERKKNSTSIFAFWPSGKIFESILKPKNLINFIKLNPVVACANFGVAIGIGEITKFKAIESKIPSLTYEFFIKLCDFIKKENLEYININFYGHSLGARLIIESFLRLPEHYKNIKVDNLVFMGGARCLNKDECEKLLSNISGKIYNIHSSSDYILKYIKPDFEKCIGMHPIQSAESSSNRLENHAFNFLGHMDYWENMREIINYLNLDKASNNFLVPNHNTLLKNSFPAKDNPLYLPICYATDSEKEIIARLICLKTSSSIDINERDPVKLTNEIQLMGGDSIANITRGHGIIYSEIVHDIAEYLKIAGYQTVGFKYLENSIHEKILSMLKNECTPTNDNNKILMTKIIQTLYRYPENGYYNEYYINSFIKLTDLFRNNNLKSLYVPGPAYSVTIPIVIMIHHIRKRLFDETGNTFLS